MAPPGRAHGSGEQARARLAADARKNVLWFIAFFVAVVSVLLSIDRSSGRLAAYAWIVIPLGVSAAVMIAVIAQILWSKAWAKTR